MHDDVGGQPFFFGDANLYFAVAQGEESI